MGWLSTHKSGKGVDAITSGIEGPWDRASDPVGTAAISTCLFGYEWELTKSPAGANQWRAKDLKDDDHAPQVDGSGEKVELMMTHRRHGDAVRPCLWTRSRSGSTRTRTSSLTRFARAWFKLTHRDMGPRRAIPGQGSPGRGTDLAGLHPGWSDAVGCGRCRPEGQDRRLWSFGIPTRFNCLGVGFNFPVARTCVAAPMVRASVCLRRRTGTSTRVAAT